MSNVRRTFVDLALSGEVIFDEIDDFVDQWHESDSDESLASFLGLSNDEYALWVSAPDAIGLILSARTERRSLLEAVNDNFEELKLAARAGETRKISTLEAWLQELSKTP